MNYVVLSLIAAFCFGMGTIISKIASKHTLHNWQQVWTYFILTYSPLPSLLALFIGKIYWPQLGIVALGLNSLFFVIALALFFRGLLTVDASVATPFFQLQSAVIVILAFLFLGERFPPTTYMWLIVLVAGSIIVSIDEKLR